MSIEKVKAEFETLGIAQRILEFPVSSATVELAAQAAGVEPARIAKTLGFTVGEQVILVVCAGDTKVDNRRYKDTFGAKAAMIPFDHAEELIGHGVGGVCPFAVNPGVALYLDASLKRFETVFPAAGSSKSAIEMTMEELERYTDATWVDVCKGWREEEV